MKKSLLLIVSVLLFATAAHAQEAKDLITAVNKKFEAVKDYNADVSMKFDLPGIKLNALKGKVYYKKPNKFRIKAKGIFFIPKDNPMKNIPTLLANTSSYTAVTSGYATVAGKRCAVVNIIPLDPNLDLVIGKFWISVENPLIYQSEITTKDNGTIRTQNTFGGYGKIGLPDQVKIIVEMKKFKIPKMLAMDLKKKSGSKTVGSNSEGEINMVMSNYKVNTKFPDTVFTEK